MLLQHFLQTNQFAFYSQAHNWKFCWTRKIRRHFLKFFPGVCTLVILRSQKLQILTTGFDNQPKLSVYVVLLSLEGGTTAFSYLLNSILWSFDDHIFFPLEPRIQEMPNKKLLLPSLSVFKHLYLQKHQNVFFNQVHTWAVNTCRKLFEWSELRLGLGVWEVIVLNCGKTLKVIFFVFQTSDSAQQPSPITLPKPQWQVFAQPGHIEKEKLLILFLASPFW